MSVAKCPHCGEDIILRTPGVNRPKYDHDAARALLKMGATQTEVAKAFGVSRQAVSYLARKLTVERTAA